MLAKQNLSGKSRLAIYFSAPARFTVLTAVSTIQNILTTQ
jgi:hypothetical protein